MKAKIGDQVEIEYTGKFEDGTVFDASEKHGKPLSFTLGQKQVIKGFDDAVLNMAVNEEKEVTIESKDGYGDHDPNMIKNIERKLLPPEVKEGMTVMAALKNGGQVPVQVVKMTDTEATLDMNHPLAGKKLIFSIKRVK